MATVDFMRKIIANSVAANDQGHMPMVAFNIPQIPDRTEAILGVGEDPFPAMRDIIRKIEDVGADFIAIPCNTAYYWYDKLSAATPLPIIHIVDAVVDELHALGIGSGPVGVIATTGTVESGIYHNRLAKHGFVGVSPDDQDAVMQGIRLVKAGYFDEAAKLFARQIELLRAVRCRQVVLACTEVPLALREAGLGTEGCIDATDALAVACTRFENSLSARQDGVIG